MKELMRRMFLTKSVSDIITVYATLVLGSILIVVVLTMLVSLFQNEKDNAQVYNLISPAFQTIVGAFVGLISGIHLGKKETDKPEPETPSKNDSPTP